MAQKRKHKEPMTESEYEQKVIFHHFPTPSQFVRHAIRYFMAEVAPLFFRRASWEHQLRILDHSAGTGVWNAVGSELLPDSYRVNVEYQLAQPIRVETAHAWHYGVRFQDYAADYLKQHAESPAIHPLFDIIWGNFPFKEGEEFIHTSATILRPRGYCFNLAPINFLSTQDRTKSLYRTWCPMRVIHIPKRISFTKDGRTDEKEYVLLVHQEGLNPRTANEDWWFDWSYDQPDLPEDSVFDSLSLPAEQPSMLDMWEGRCND